MAQKRMFDKAIIDTDSFMDLPMSGKAIYFLLGMEADNEGFVSYKKVIRIHGGNEDDVKILTAKGFLILFKSGVVVITNWNQNNYLDKNRITPTQYQKEKKLLVLTNDRKYELNNNLTIVQPVEESRGEQSIDSDLQSHEVFSLKGEIKKLEDNPRRDLNIIALYLEEKKPDIRTKEQLSVAIKRHLRGAKQLCPFTDTQIIDAIPKARKSTSEYTLETLVKILTK